MEDDIEFKKYLSERKYDKCIRIIQSKIVNHIVKLIKEKNEDYEYIDIYDLIEASNVYLDHENAEIASKIRYYSIEEEPLENLERLMKLCETYKVR